MSLFERTSGRRITVGAVLTALAFVAFLSFGNPGMADAGKPKKAKKAKVTLSVKTGTQAGLISTGKLKVQVRSTAKAKVRLAAYRGSGKSFRSKTVRFRKRGKKVVTLPLTAAGRTAVSKCGAVKVKVVAKYRKGQKKARATRTKSLRRDSNRCVSPVTVPLGDNPERCDFLDSTVCLQPFPNDYYTRPDSSTETGRRLNIHPESTPANKDGVHISVTDMNRGDGFSPGNAIMLKVPGLDTPSAFSNSGLVPINDLRSWDAADAPVMVIDAETGERQPIWAELDSNPTSVDPSDDGPGGINTNPGNTEDVNLFVRPAKNFEYGRRYIVAFRNLRDASDQPIEAPLGFRVYRDGLPTEQSPVEDRRDHMESVIGDVVGKAGVERSSLYMAWDFTVASEESITSRALQIRDDAFARLGDLDLADREIDGDSPELEILAVCDQGDAPTCGDGANGLPVPSGDILRYVEGRIKNVPCYLNQNGCPPGSTFEFDSDGSIDFDPAFTMNVQFRCIVPKSVQPGGPDTAVIPGPAGTYGHGLLGDYRQVNDGGLARVARDGGGIWCGANWAGFSSSDLLTIFNSLGDMSNFNKAVDRMQQGFVNFMLLNRALIHPGGFAALDAFKLDDDGNNLTPEVPVIDLSEGTSTRGQYLGISQGGIMGGALMALSPDVDRGVLDVLGMNYSTLLRRSVDSDGYFKIPNVGLYASSPDESERRVLLYLLQLLWDRGEANGYAQSMTSDPLPNTPPHDVLLKAALGDHQVANVTAEVKARTIGASVYAPALNPGRHWETDPFSGLVEQSTFPWDDGSMLVYYDSGPIVATPPNENLPPRGEWGYGIDPHGHPRSSVDGVSHAVTFLDDGTINSCAAITPGPNPSDAHCYANGWTGP